MFQKNLHSLLEKMRPIVEKNQNRFVKARQFLQKVLDEPELQVKMIPEHSCLQSEETSEANPFSVNGMYRNYYTLFRKLICESEAIDCASSSIRQRKQFV